MNETYTIMVKLDYENDEGCLVVTENGRNGDPKLVNVIDDMNEVGELYERLTGREVY